MFSPFALGAGGGVVFISAWQGRHMLRAVAAEKGDAPIGVLDIQRLKAIPSFETAALIICDIERYSASTEKTLAAAIRAWTRAHPELTVFNQPPHAMRRFALLKTLAKEGVNQTEVYRLDDPTAYDLVRFPCFVRDENGHHLDGEPPRLLFSRDELTAHMTELTEVGEPLYGKAVFEFEDLRDENGLYAKYSYFRIGDALIPGHLFFSTNWFVKAPEEKLLQQNADLLEREQRFYKDESHREEIRDVFDIAGVQYGRIDYGVRPDGGLHIFEINTNPNYPDLAYASPHRREFLNQVQSRIRAAICNIATGRELVRLKWPRDAYWRKIRKTFRPT